MSESYGKTRRQRMGRVAEHGIALLERIEEAGAGRRVLAVYAMDALPERAAAGTLAAVWFAPRLAESTRVTRVAKLAEQADRQGCALAVVGMRRDALPAELAEPVERFVV